MAPVIAPALPRRARPRRARRRGARSRARPASPSGRPPRASGSRRCASGRSARARRPPRTARGSLRGPSRDPRARRRSPGGARAPSRTTGSSAAAFVLLMWSPSRGRGADARPRASRTRTVVSGREGRGVRHGRRLALPCHDRVAAREDAQRAQGLEPPGRDAELLVRGRDASRHPVRGGAPLLRRRARRGTGSAARSTQRADPLLETGDARREGERDSSKGGKEGGGRGARLGRARAAAAGNPRERRRGASRGKSREPPCPFFLSERIFKSLSPRVEALLETVQPLDDELRRLRRRGRADVGREVGERDVHLVARPPRRPARARPRRPGRRPRR